VAPPMSEQVASSVYLGWMDDSLANQGFDLLRPQNTDGSCSWKQPRTEIVGLVNRPIVFYRCWCCGERSQFVVTGCTFARWTLGGGQWAGASGAARVKVAEERGLGG